MNRDDLPEPLCGAEAEALVASILARTSGAPCAGIEDRLLARSDGALAAGELELVDEHLAHCAGCRELAEALAILKTELPALAEIDPGPWFTAQVLHRTVAAGRTGPTWSSRLRESWRALARRPRFAVEIAYVAAMFLVLVIGSPAPLLREFREKPAIFPAAGTLGLDVDPWPEGRPLAGIAERLRAEWEGPARRPVTARAARTARSIVAAVDRLFLAGEIIGTRISDATRAAFRGDFASAWWNWERLRAEVRTAWDSRARSTRPGDSPSAAPVPRRADDSPSAAPAPERTSGTPDAISESVTEPAAPALRTDGRTDTMNRP